MTTIDYHHMFAVMIINPSSSSSSSSHILLLLLLSLLLSCEACVDALFTRPSAACPECGLALRRNLFRLQQFEDSYVEKEVEIRKKILKE